MPLITDQMMYTNLRQSLMQSQVRMAQAQSQVSSGMRVAQASDDPAAAGHGVLLDSTLNVLSGMKTAADRIAVNLDTLGSDLQDTQGALARAKELLTQANNGSLIASDREDIAAEMQSLQQVVLAIANKQDEAGNYLYSGYQTATAPFDTAGTYSGDSQARLVEVAPNLKVRTNVPGNEIFNILGGNNILGTLGDAVTALQNNDLAAAQNSLALLDKSINQVAVAQATAGGQQLLLRGAQTTRDTAQLATQKTRQSVLEVDSIKAISDSVEAQAAYEQALASSGQLLRILQGMGKN